MTDVSYIQIALELAKKGKGLVSPLPMAGAVYVKNNKIIGAAYRSNQHEEPAEILAIKNSKESVEDSFLYTNLEPCTTCQKDIACIDYIIQSKIKKVVIGSVNPHPSFGGMAVKKLKRAGIEVKTGVLEKECIELNKFYFKHCTNSVPYVTMKMAVTIDGKIADSDYNSKWITSVESRSLVHELRSSYDAVLVGIKTVKADNPKLDVRLVEGRNPKRIVIDSKLEIDPEFKVIKANKDNNVIVITSKKNKTKKRKLQKLLNHGVEVIFVPEEKDGRVDLVNALKKIGGKNIISVLVEGGGKVFSSFIKAKLDDEILIFIGPKILGNGIPLADGLGIKSIQKAFSYCIKDMDKVGEDALLKLVRR